MREIKFRGKREDNGEWAYGSFIPDALEGGNSDLVSWGFIRRYNRDIAKMETIEVDRETIGQFTGLKDRNGKEIYEGDIVSFEDSDGGYEYPDLVVNTGIVEYGELGFYFTNRVAVEMDDFYIKDGRCDEVEVIGNIHDQAGDE